MTEYGAAIHKRIYPPTLHITRTSLMGEVAIGGQADAGDIPFAEIVLAIKASTDEAR